MLLLLASKIKFMGLTLVVNVAEFAEFFLAFNFGLKFIVVHGIKFFKNLLFLNEQRLFLSLQFGLKCIVDPKKMRKLISEFSI